MNEKLIDHILMRCPEDSNGQVQIDGGVLREMLTVLRAGDEKNYCSEITFNSSTTWVMRIKANKVEVNACVEVSEAAQAVLDALTPMLFKPWVGLTDDEMSQCSYDAEGFMIEREVAMRAVEALLKEKNT
jgi:hypothetical protein